MTSQIPTSLIAGDTWAWTSALANYPAPTWTATALFANADGSFTATATASGSDHAFSIDAATTAGKKAGRYRVSVRVTSGATVTTAQESWVNVMANPAGAGTHDPRSNARKMLDALEATLLGRATTDQLAMTLNGRSIARTPLPELRDWRNQLRAEVATEEAGANAGLGRDIKTRFSRG